MSILFYSSAVIPIIKTAIEHKCPILFVKDEGVYLMVKTNEKPIIAYAKHCNPNSDADYFEYSCRYLGGDDFVEEYDPHQEIFESVIRFQLNLSVLLDEKQLIISAVRGG